MSKTTAKYCGNCGKRTKQTNKRKSPVGRGVTVCEGCRRRQAKGVREDV